MGDQDFAQERRREGLHLVDIVSELYPARLAPASGVDLGLDDDHRRRQILGDPRGFLGAECRVAVRHLDAELLQDLLALVLVDVHRLASLSECPAPGPLPARTKARRERDLRPTPLLLYRVFSISSTKFRKRTDRDFHLHLLVIQYKCFVLYIPCL